MIMNTRTDHARTRSPIHVLFSALIVFSLLATTAGAALAAPQQPAAEQAQQPSVKPPEKPGSIPAASPSLQDTTNILLLGSDRRPNMPNWRTDVMMILAIDEATRQVGVISLPRDIYVDEIPNHRGNKINVIDYLGEQDEPDGGGPKLLGQIIEKKIGVPIDHFIRFDFEAFKKLVDAMGGVEIEVDCPLYDPQGYDQGGLPLALKKGVHRLNGGQALSYVRSRLVGGDLERERRQQRFAWAVRSQILNENLLARVPAMYQALNDHVQTDIGLRDAIKLVRFALDLDSENVHGFVVNDPSMIKQGYAGQMWVWYPNWANIAEAARALFDTPPLLDTNTQDEKCP
jgi:polyisoprenyl-teichoic acid--peptidoglycan teichoic acid transferase